MFTTTFVRNTGNWAFNIAPNYIRSEYSQFFKDGEGKLNRKVSLAQQGIAEKLSSWQESFDIAYVGTSGWQVSAKSDQFIVYTVVYV